MIQGPDQDILLGIARETLISYTVDKRILPLENGAYSGVLRDELGVFVSLHKSGSLRGCIGRMQSSVPLFQQVRDMTISAASKDYRFQEVRADEIDEIRIEISVLSPMKRIDLISEIIPGKHGIYLRKGERSGTYLPQVAQQTGWNIEELLGHCAKDKAGIGWEGWREAEIFVYESLVFAEAH